MAAKGKCEQRNGEALERPTAHTSQLSRKSHNHMRRAEGLVCEADTMLL